MTTEAEQPKPKNNTNKTLALGVRLPHEVVARMDALAPKLVAAGLAEVQPSRSDMLNRAVLDYLATREAKVAAAVAPAPKPKAPKAKK